MTETILRSMRETLFRKPQYELRCVKIDGTYKVVGEPSENIGQLKSLKRDLIAMAVKKDLDGTFLIYNQEGKIVN